MDKFFGTLLNTSQYQQFTGHFGWLVIAAIIWSLIWKGFALWHSARNSQKAWFIVLLIVNTLGILEIIYLFGFKKSKMS